MKFPVKTVAVITSTILLATGCKGGDGTRAKSVSYAGDGVTQFGDPNGANTFANEGASGKLKWGVTYHPDAEDSTDITNCHWSLFSINSEGVTVFIMKGNYLSGPINFGEQRTKKVYLKSLECGLWKPHK